MIMLFIAVICILCVNYLGHWCKSCIHESYHTVSFPIASSTASDRWLDWRLEGWNQTACLAWSLIRWKTGESITKEPYLYHLFVICSDITVISTGVFSVKSKMVNSTIYLPVFTNLQYWSHFHYMYPWLFFLSTVFDFSSFYSSSALLWKWQLPSPAILLLWRVQTVPF